MRSLIAGFLITVSGFAIVAWATDGFRAVLLETARKLSINAQHPAFPDVAVEDQFGGQMRIADFGGRTVVATFIYARCATLCTVTGTDIAWLRNSIRALKKSGTSSPDVQWLSITFDERDDGAALQDYAHRHQADAPDWRIVRVPRVAERRKMLREMGVIAIPDGMGGFTHNAALYVIGPDSRVRSIHDIDAAPAVLATLLSSR